MTLNELRYVVAVAHQRHFGRAARDCFVSQSALSVGLKKLEDELGVVLFERGFGQVLPTAAGERVIATAQRVLDEVEQLKQAAAGDDATDEPLRIGVIHTVSPYLLPNLIPTLRKQQPDLSLVVEDGLTFSLSQRLKQGSLDMIIIAEPFDEPGIDTLALYEEPFVIALPGEHRLSKRRTIAAADLEQESVLLLAPGNCFRDQVVHACPGCVNTGRRNWQGMLESNSLETLRHMVVSGVGVTVLPASAAHHAAYSDSILSIRPFAKPVPTRRIALAWRSGYRRARATAALRTSIRKALPKGAVLVDSAT